MFAMFDLPVNSKQNRRDYAQFRKLLLKLGFTMLQFSVYAKNLPSEDAAKNLEIVIGAAVPPKGEVRLLSVTDRQFGKMAVYFGRKRKKPEEAPKQIGLF
jgi:CRISPR-associated protein Cas2